METFVLKSAGLKEFRVTYGTLAPHPTARSCWYPVNQRVLIVAATDRIDAYCVAFDHLTRNGHRIGGISHRWPITKEEFQLAVQRGVPESAQDPGGQGSTSIVEIAPHAVQVTGQVRGDG